MSQFEIRNKQSNVMRSLAREFLILDLSDRILSVKEYAEKYSVGTGTVQGAFAELKRCGAIELNPCGSLGTFVTKLDNDKLLEIGEYGPFLGLLPLDDNINIKGLASGIYECFIQAKLPIHILFARGSRNRVKILSREKCDFVVINKLAFDYAKKQGESIKLITEIKGEQKQYGFIVPKGKKFDINTTKIAVDAYSYEQISIMHNLIEGGVPYLNYLGVQLMDVVEKREVEAALVDKIILRERKDFDFIPLKDIKNEIDYTEFNYVIALREGDDELVRLLRRIISNKIVSETQKQVIKKTRLVTY